MSYLKNKLTMFHTTSLTTLIAPLVAGFVTTLIGYASTYPIVLEAAKAMHLDQYQITVLSTMLLLGMSLCTFLPSLYYKMPIMVVWSTPGAALLAVSAGHIPIAELIGAFMMVGLLTVLIGISGWFDKLIAYIPLSIASAILAGILIHFSLQTFANLGNVWFYLLPMALTYLVIKRLSSRFVIPWVMIIGLIALIANQQLSPALSHQSHFPPLHYFFGISPEFHWHTLLSIGLPLFFVTMASQNLPGVAVIKASGYPVPIPKIITYTGIATVLLAPFGVFGLNLSAITAAMAMGEEAHPDRNKRYLAALWTGGFYFVIGISSWLITDLFLRLPSLYVVGLAGLALIPTITKGLHTALEHEQEREAALVTFVITASGLKLWGIGAAFWGGVAGIICLLVWRKRIPKNNIHQH
jgi:benzoate membrane transport protein